MRKAKGNQFPVIVIGAGPAGAIMAYELARKGIDVLVLEKAKIPRDKPCAGGVLIKASNLLPFDIHPIVEQAIYGFTFTCNLINKFTRTYEKPIAYTVNRTNFDTFLIDKAKKEGAKVKEEIKVCGIMTSQKKGEMTQVVTQNGSFFANIIVGADGVYSITARSLGLNIHRYEYALVENIKLHNKDNVLGLLRIDWGYLSSGYAWSFPKKGFYSVGVGGTKKEEQRLVNYLSIFVTEHFNTKLEIEQPRFFNALPFRQNNSPIQRGACLLIGDAAGLVEPFTREGISSAIKSAQIGAKTILNALKGTSDISEYELLINKEIMIELKSAENLKVVFDASPIDFHCTLRENTTLWNLFCEILRGNASYTTLEAGLKKGSAHEKSLIKPK